MTRKAKITLAQILLCALVIPAVMIFISILSPDNEMDLMWELIDEIPLLKNLADTIKTVIEQFSAYGVSGGLEYYLSLNTATDIINNIGNNIYQALVIGLCGYVIRCVFIMVGIDSYVPVFETILGLILGCITWAAVSGDEVGTEIGLIFLLFVLVVVTTLFALPLKEDKTINFSLGKIVTVVISKLLETCCCSFIAALAGMYVIVAVLICEGVMGVAMAVIVSLLFFVQLVALIILVNVLSKISERMHYLPTIRKFRTVYNVLHNIDND